MDTKQLGTYLARGRVGVGLVALVAPGPTLTITFGRGANNPGARAMARLAGARDATIGAGGSIAIGQRAGGGDWLSMMAVVDGFDALVMLLTPGLPKRARLIGLGAAGSAVLHLFLARDIATQELEAPLVRVPR
jgi:hypothetical protein